MSSSLDPCTNRLERVIALLAKTDAEGVLFFDLKNIRYLVGFTGSDGALLITPSGAQLLVDGRYATQAKNEAPAARVAQYQDKTEGIAALLAEGGYRRVAFEAAALSHDLFLKLQERNGTVAFKALRLEDLAGLRAVKDLTEIGRIKEAAALAARAFQATLAIIKPGLRERDVALELDYRMRIHGAEEPAFQTIAASGPNSAMPHARPGERVIEQDDVLIIDWGAVYNGYRSDETCTLVVGKAPADFTCAYNLVREAHDRAIASIRPGVSTAEVDRQAREWIVQGGMGDLFSHGTGHGVGLDIHESPRLAANTDGILQAGMVVTVEPGVYLPGRWGIRIEDLVLVTEDGCDILSGVDKKDFIELN